MPLTDTAIRNAKPGSKPFKIAFARMSLPAWETAFLLRSLNVILLSKFITAELVKIAWGGGKKLIRI